MIKIWTMRKERGVGCFMSDLKIPSIGKVKTTKEIVYEEIKNAIFCGNIKSDQLLTETILANTLNTSRTPVREAVADLLKEGLLVSIPRKGFKVRQISSSEKDQLFFLRLSIETEGLNRLLARATPEQIDHLKKVIALQKEAMLTNDRIKFIDLDQTFHKRILSFAELHLLEDIFLNIYDLARLLGHQALAKKGRMEEVIHEHLKIVEALSAKDSSLASKSIKAHINNTRDSITSPENG